MPRAVEPNKKLRGAKVKVNIFMVDMGTKINATPCVVVEPNKKLRGAKVKVIIFYDRHGCKDQCKYDFHIFCQHFC